jgi:hypothetical protein
MSWDLRKLQRFEHTGAQVSWNAWVNSPARSAGA